jgi:hypothetical protein
MRSADSRTAIIGALLRTSSAGLVESGNGSVEAIAVKLRLAQITQTVAVDRRFPTSHFEELPMKDRTWEIMQKHLDSGCYDLVSAQDSAPSAAELQRVASALGCTFPEEFIVHSTNKYGGVCIAVKEELWSRPKPADVGPFWSFLYGLYTLNSVEGIPDFMDLLENGREFRQETSLPGVPLQ